MDRERVESSVKPGELTAAGLDHEYVAVPRKGRAIGHHAGEPDSRARRVVDRDSGDAVAARLRDDLAADVGRSVGAREHRVNRFKIVMDACGRSPCVRVTSGVA